ncbi:MAG: gliding motility protein GldC [Flavobacteriales bacterium TMED113]|nr:MAG: gliding motility protein GldC [Flavobacteriales bacterium TMED113]
MKKQLKKAKINIEIELNENNIAENISWLASDSGQDYIDSKSMILSMWDGEKKEALSIDIWTKDMTVQEMKFFTFQILLKMNEVIKKSTGDEKLVSEMRKFIKKLGIMMDVLKK